MKRKIKYDVFISYKRRGGTPWAELLFLALAKIKKKRVFIDRDGLGGGTFKKWKTAINEAIESSANVIVVVFPGIQDVIKDKDDFFIAEIAKALNEKDQRKLNIIPFYVDGLSSQVIQSDDQYEWLPSEVKEITSRDYNDVSFDSKYPDAWVDYLVSKVLISEDDILEEYCYRVQVNAYGKITVYNELVSSGNKSKGRKLNKGTDTSYWIEKNGGFLSLRFEDGENQYPSYIVTIDTIDQTMSKIPRENSVHYNIKDGSFHAVDGIFKMVGDTIFLTIDWSVIDFYRSLERSFPHKDSQYPPIDSLINAYQPKVVERAEIIH